MDDDLPRVLKASAKKRGKGEYERRIEAKYRKNLHKELLDWQNSLGRSQINPEDTLYRWWWEFMRAAEEHPTVKDEAIKAVAGLEEQRSRRAKTSMAFGELGADFGVWWYKVGQKIFAEETVPLIHVIKPDPSDEEFKRETGVIMIVPMTISRNLLMEQFKVVLDVYHPNARFKRHEASTAAMKIYPRQRDVKKDYDQLLRVWRAKRANAALPKADQKDDWELCCDVFGFHDLKAQLLVKWPKGETKSTATAQRVELASEINDLYRQADELMRNALLGEFPRDDVYQQKKGRKSAEERRSEKEAKGKSTIAPKRK